MHAMLKTCLIAVLGLALTAFQPAHGQRGNPGVGKPEAEFHMARLVYRTRYGNGFRPWWAIDYPEAEFHLLQGLRRLTRLDVAADSAHVNLLDDTIFDYPWLFAQQVSYWELNDVEAARLREYLLRGGFLVVDDFHTLYEWAAFAQQIVRVFPDRAIIDIPEGDPLLHILYDLDQRTQIPGRRHIYRYGGQTIVEMPGSPPRWRGIYDDQERLMVAINFNMDMGDAWEHADDPVYPEPMTALAYRFGINYIIYAMTH
jgi:hypothetical protein